MSYILLKFVMCVWLVLYVVSFKLHHSRMVSHWVKVRATNYLFGPSLCHLNFQNVVEEKGSDYSFCTDSTPHSKFNVT